MRLFRSFIFSNVPDLSGPIALTYFDNFVIGLSENTIIGLVIVE